MRKIINLERFIKIKWLREWVEALLFAIIVATIFRTWLYSPFRVPTGSMIPTILEGDQLFADMHAYGFVIPFTESKVLEEPIERGDIIIFPSPQNPAKCDTWYYSFYDITKSLLMGFINPRYAPTCIDYIKRAVALEGDSIRFSGEQVYINGELEKGYTPYLDPRSGPILLRDSITIPPGKLYAMGDNRRNSLDSRFWGFVEKKNVRAKARWIYLSIDPQEGIFGGLRFVRMFTPLH